MNAYHQETHEMTFERSLADHVDELYCPTCGRRTVIQWSPDFNMIVLCEGEEEALHTAHRGSRSLGSAQIFAVEEPEVQLPEADPIRLAEWEDLFTKIDFESWWTKS